MRVGVMAPWRSAVDGRRRTRAACAATSGLATNVRALVASAEVETRDRAGS
jgi:hypothetical protein